MKRPFVRIISAILAPVLVAATFRAPPALARSNSDGPRLMLIRDAETESLLRTYANPLFRAAGVDPNLVRIVLVRDSAINSFVSTGNILFVHTGLIMKAGSANEMVGVLAHETGHIAGGHLAKLPDALREAMIESLAAMLIGVAAGVASREGAGIGAGLGGQHMAQRNFLSFTRSMERAADQAGVRFLDANGWSSQGLLDLFHHLEGQEILLTRMKDPYVLTHPLTRERTTFVEDHAARSPFTNRKLPEGFESGFQMVRAKLIGFLNPSSETLRAVRGDDPPSRYARAIALYRLGHLGEALPMVDQLIAERKSSPWLHELKGQMLFENGRVREAIGPYRDAVRLAPDQPQIHISLAQAMVETGDPLLLRPAIRELQPALDQEHDNTTGWRTLATAWGKLGDVGQANLALAEEALENGKIPLARGLAAKAETQLPQGPAKVRAVDISNAVKKENRTGF